MLLQFLGYGFVIVVYGLFAWFGKAPVDGFIAVLTGAIAMLGGVHAYSTASKRATDAANFANPVPPPNIATLPTSVTNDDHSKIVLTGSQGGFANPFLLASIAITILLVVSLTGCANMLQGQKDAWEDVGAVAEGAAIIAVDIAAPIETTTTTTRTCDKDRHGDIQCTTTTEGN